MERLVIAFSNDKTREMVCSVLEGGGMTIRAAVRTGAEALRQVKFMGGGVVICPPRLPDRTAAQLCEDLDSSAFLLVIGSASQIADLEGENVFTLPSPFSRGELLAATRMLRQMEEKQLMYLLPNKKHAEDDILRRAKELLITRRGMSEEQAHKYIQQMSMQRGVKASLIAREIVEEQDG